MESKASLFFLHSQLFYIFTVLQEVLKSVPKFAFPYSTYEARYVYCFNLLTHYIQLHVAGFNWPYI